MQQQTSQKKRRVFGVFRSLPNEFSEEIHLFREVSIHFFGHSIY